MDLYALPPEEFTAARDAAAKADKGLKALRRPTVAAWVVNTLVRREPALLDELVALGADLAAAQRDGQGDALRALGEQRRALVRAVADRAQELAERPLTAAVRDEVEGTLEAALADPASGEAVRSGRLVRALSYAGFGVDLDGAVAPAAAPPSPPTERSTARTARKARGEAAPRAAEEQRQERERRERVRAAEAAAHEAAGHLDDVVRAAQAATAAVESAAADLDRAADEVERAEQALAAARTQRTESERAHREAVTGARRATRRVGPAQQRADDARAALDALRRG